MPLKTCRSYRYRVKKKNNNKILINLLGEVFLADADWLKPECQKGSLGSVQTNALSEAMVQIRTAYLLDTLTQVSKRLITTVNVRNKKISTRSAEHEAKKSATSADDNKETDLVTDLVRMGYFFSRTRYCCKIRK